MELAELRKNWERFGEEDPLWAILTSPDRRYGRWHVDEFFETGRFEVERVLERLASLLAPAPLPAGRALDFGCGVGRATQALCERFTQCDGVDISASMIERARAFNRHGERCAYHLNAEQDLSLFADGTFDFVYTAHVLQHMEPRFAEVYVHEFFRILKPRGVALFEITTESLFVRAAPLPESAFRAEITLIDAPATLRPGETGSAGVRVRNLGDTLWPAQRNHGWHHVTVGNHWLKGWPRPGTVKLDDGRGFLRHDVTPGETIEVRVPVTAPGRPGRYVLEFDLVQEGVGWFATHGSKTVSVPVKVAGPRPPAASEPRETVNGGAPVMEMYGTPDETVRAWISAAGGELVGSFSWDEITGRPSREWSRRVYVARRAA